MRKVTNEEIKRLLVAVNEPMTNAEIREALDYPYDAMYEISARLRGMEKRPNQKIQATNKGNKRAWFVISNNYGVLIRKVA